MVMTVTMSENLLNTLYPMFIWSVEKQIGYYPVNGPVPYDRAYFDKYVAYAETEMGRRITEFRVKLTNSVTRGMVIDVGCGAGQFIATRGMEITHGFDINPSSVEWLKKNNVYATPYRPNNYDCMTFWDSLEHIASPLTLLQYCKRYVIVSIPIFSGPGHVVVSKHFRPDEHYWYFTKHGLVEFMRMAGFSFVSIHDDETRLGREDIETFVFHRRWRG